MTEDATNIVCPLANVANAIAHVVLLVSGTVLLLHFLGFAALSAFGSIGAIALLQIACIKYQGNLSTMQMEADSRLTSALEEVLPGMMKALPRVRSGALSN